MAVAAAAVAFNNKHDVYRSMTLLDRLETVSNRSLTRARMQLLRRIGLWLALSFSTSLYAEPVTIVHPSEGHMRLERKTLRAAFSMAMQTWPDGTPLTVFVFKDETPLHQDFCRKALGVLPYSLRRNWDRLLFSGAGQAPLVAESAKDMLHKVATTPGAIGYIDRELVDESVSIVEIAQ